VAHENWLGWAAGERRISGVAKKMKAASEESIEEKYRLCWLWREDC